MADKLEVLRKGDDWKLLMQSPQTRLVSSDENLSSRRATDRFSKLAKEHGSAAIWLPETGYLITEDPTEPAKNFPYEEWRDQVLNEAGYI